MSTTTAPLSASQRSATGITDIVRAILAPIASLKVTVFLLVLAVFVTWVVTLEQATIDIWELKNKHYSSLFVYVPLNTFLPPNWFPNAPQMKAGLILPSGLAIIIAMLMNLTAAHLLRFRIQAKGARLWTGLIVSLVAAAVTWVVIFNYQDSDGFGGKPPVPWAQLWVYLQVVVLGLAIGCAYAAFAIGNGRMVERLVYALGAITLFFLLGLSVMLGEEAFIGDSAMRILWQLSLSTLAAITGLAACILLFKRKSGIVLLHLGIAGILANELYVTATNEELRVNFAEGQTVHHAIDLRETEFVVIDRNNTDFDEMSVVPGNFLVDAREDVIDDERFPFKIRCLDYFKNSDVMRVGPFAENKANSGFGTRFIAVETRPVAGADASSKANRASAYIELIDRKNDKPIGTYLVSQAAYEQDIVDTVSYDDKSYQIGLRYKTVYTPYSLELKDTQAEYYVGTETPSWFSSDFVINDEDNGISSNQKIWMNNPLRYRDLTFYQTTYNKFEGQEYSGIQVVKNRGWMIPYVCCMFVVVGLVAQFYQTLTTHLSKTSRQKDSVPLAELADVGKPGSNTSFWYVWGPTIVLMGIFGLYTASKAARSISAKVTKAKGSDIRLDLFGRLPVTFGGRVQPLDSFARNTARRLGNREYVIDEFGNKQPAIRWLADSIFGASAAEEYQILRIEDLSVQNALGLQYRKGMKYTFAELRQANSKLIEQLIEADKLPEEQWTPYHHRLSEVFSKTRYLMGVNTLMYGTEGRYNEGDLLERIEVAANLAHTKSAIPLALPTRDQEQPWVPFSLYLEQKMLNDLADASGTKSNAELATFLLDQETEKLKATLIKQKIIRDLMQYEEVVEELATQFNLDDPQQLADVLERNWHMLPSGLYEDEMKDAEAFVDIRLKQWRMQPDEFGMSKDQSLFVMIKDIRGEDGTKLVDVDPEVVDNLINLKTAYLESDANAFNSSMQKHLASVEAASPSGWSATQQNAEISYNFFSPFYMASVLYLAAFLVTIVSWIGWRKPLGRAAFWLVVLALVVHLGGVAARVVISGRPPITNLYSSFVVVAAGCVLFLLLIEYSTKLGLGNLLGSACGFLTLCYAWTLSISQGDTFTVLRAVLDTQFWLTTHVIIINLGYSATLVAGLVGVALLFCMFLNPGFDKKSRKQFVNIIYGTTCFALLFSFFGTVLGGLWADDSWGRFWGWDPKENGALMIVLWNAVLLHAKWAGIVRERGLAAIAALGNVIVIWSWEGVNQLGVGLHAYSGMGGGGGTASIWFEPIFYLQLFCGFNFVLAILAIAIPSSMFRSLASENSA